MSVSDISVFKSRFGAITFEAIPYQNAAVLDGNDVAAIVVEPLVQAAAGIRMIPSAVYNDLAHHDALVIVDEIATGFGRTGTMFAYEQTKVKPDLVCVGKGITGGALALSATLATRRIYDAFLGAPEERKHFFHGHSYAGNPIACAAALANIDLFEEEKTLENVGTIGVVTSARLQVIAAHPSVKETRQLGTMVGIELHDARHAWPVANKLYELGHFTRPIGPVVQFVPPLSTTVGEVHDFFDALAKALPR
jgi:adenosylmethionine-8-amino-7-oxononanoate aminotransferase